MKKKKNGSGEWQPMDENGRFASNDSMEKSFDDFGGARKQLSFRNQLEQVQAGTFNTKTNLIFGNTPAIFVEKAGLPNLPMTMPYKKAYLAMNDSGIFVGKGDHYHGLGIDTLSQLPVALQDPLYIFESPKDKQVEAVVSLKGKNGVNVFAVIAFDTRSEIDGKYKKSNVVVTAYAPDSKRYIESRRVNTIYEKKS